MRVNDPNLNAAQVNPTGANGTNQTGATTRSAQMDPVRVTTTSSGPTAAGERGDEVKLSALSSKINELQTGSPEREAYLEQLRLQVASGQYEADPRATAAAMIDDAFLKSE